MSSKIHIFTILLLVILIGIAAWFFLEGRGRGKIRNVLLISIDTCRADHLSCYGYIRRTTTPNIDAVAEEGIVFENVVSPIPLTLPAHSSMLTGTIPPYHGVHDNIDYRLGQPNVTVAEILKDNGCTTAAIISSFVMDSQFGLDQGFDSYNDRFDEEHYIGDFSERKAEETSRHAIKWLEEYCHQPFFLFLHYYDPHFPYEPPEPFKSDFPRDTYAGEIAYTDHCIGQVIEKVKSLDIYDSTLIIITADHGEGREEHGEKTHGYFIYQSCLKVPLIVRLPGRHKPRRIGDVVGLIDIAPTILGALGLAIPQEMAGKNLLSSLINKNPVDEDRYIYCESLLPTQYQCNSLLGIVNNRFKYIQTTRPELYDLSKDPHELNNLANQQQQIGRVLQDRLKQILEEQVRGAGSDSKFALDSESKTRLESLGYVSGGNIDESFEFNQTKSDPKDYINFHQNKRIVTTYMFLGRLKQAKELCAQMISEHPDIAFTYFLLGDIALNEKEFDKAVTYFFQALRLDPKYWKAQKGLGVAFFNLKQLDEAIKHYKEALLLKPDGSTIYYELGAAYAHQEKLDDAIKCWNEALKYGSDPKVHKDLADALNHQGKADEAIGHWQESLKLDGDNAKVHADLAHALTRKGKISKAIVHLTESLRLEPAQPVLLNPLAELLYADGKIPEAIMRWKQALALKPNLPRALNNLAWITATHPDEKFRNPTEAIQLAEKACRLTKFENPEFLDTLSAAYATAGEFNKAVQTAEKALRLYRDSKFEEKVVEIQYRIELYKTGQPYRCSPPAQSNASL
jgi:arylsulfatase A-like enzyme/Flp pilus assembly protein TadD